mgnify:CR=1 FL=1
MPKLIFFTLMLVLMTSCGTTARMIEIGSDEDLTTISSIDPRDWQKAAADSISAMLESGALKRADGRKNVVMISRIRNYTLQHLDSRLLTAKMRQAILISTLFSQSARPASVFLASGQAIVTSAIGNSSNIDLAVRRIRDKEYDDLFDQSTVQKRGTVIAPDLSLSGSITQQTTVQGRTEESYFVFHLVLTDLKTGLALWENNVEIAKQGTHSIFE